MLGVTGGRLFASQDWAVAEPTLGVLKRGCPSFPLGGGSGVGSLTIHSTVGCPLAARTSSEHAVRSVRVSQQEMGSLVCVSCGAAGRG